MIRQGKQPLQSPFLATTWYRPFRGEYHEVQHLRPIGGGGSLEAKRLENEIEGGTVDAGVRSSRQRSKSVKRLTGVARRYRSPSHATALATAALRSMAAVLSGFAYRMRRPFKLVVVWRQYIAAFPGCRPIIAPRDGFSDLIRESSHIWQE
jgi:hypothetical protein